MPWPPPQYAPAFHARHPFPILKLSNQEWKELQEKLNVDLDVSFLKTTKEEESGDKGTRGSRCEINYKL